MSQDALVKIAKKLKKNNVAVDIVSFGCEEENGEKLEAFHAAVNSNDNSHLVTVPPGTILSDMLFGTPIFMEEGAGGGGDGVEGGAPAPRSECRAGLRACLSPRRALCCLCRSAALQPARCGACVKARGPAGFATVLTSVYGPCLAGNVVDGFDYGELGVDPTLDPELVRGGLPASWPAGTRAAQSASPAAPAPASRCGVLHLRLCLSTDVSINHARRLAG